MPRSAWFIATLPFVVTACVTTSYSTRTWAEPREGRVEQVRETTVERVGDPGAGAAAGAVIGGLLGGIITGRGFGALAGAAGGAVVGAGTSQGRAEGRFYDVSVRFDDGERVVFRYHGFPPFGVGQRVLWSDQGLIATGPTTTSSVAAGAAPVGTAPTAAPPPPPATPPAPQTPTAQAAAPATAVNGAWSYTQQYGWIWMPYGSVYTYTPDYRYGYPYMYVYYPAHGWLWLEAPWLWGWGPRPYFTVTPSYWWYRNQGWGTGWVGPRPERYQWPHPPIHHAPPRTGHPGRRR
ncbi:MAG: hypothetical protein KC933_40630 [Myxococcales bacterium]|nr:hypothetical protein [Myxococcales bacterium]